MNTVKVKPWGKDQGEFVLINEDDFDPKAHELLEPVSKDRPSSRRTVKAEVGEGAE
ncbi:hypothetical protein ACFSKY_00115 [Azotobacter chroococcum]|uniref:Uncharacterized protein n=1 Tax=Azotobacter chroococcum TaxID=353 RepID=A0A4R1PH40_9GAMM|nr:hypothetical protein [Azotobacter chroococcum]TCL26822.1 hypothetical protein EV691_12927 [Azotobacter chroococcum]